MYSTDIFTTATPNGSKECPVTDPSSEEIWQAVQGNPAWLAGFIFLSVGTSILFFSFLEACVFVARKIPHGETATSLVWIIGIYPTFAVTSLLGLYFPRAVVLCNFTASLYFSVSLYQAWLLFMFYFGDEDKAYSYMIGQDISLLLCCKKPSFQITGNKFRLLKACILQVATLQPVILFIGDILWLNGTYHSSEFEWNDAFLYLNIVSFISNTVALVALAITYNASRPHLQKKFYISQKFLIITLALIFANMQTYVLHMLTFLDVIPCEPPFETTQRANRYQSLIMLVESFLVYPMALIYFRTRKGNIVDILDMREPTLKYDALSNGYIRTKKKPPKGIIDEKLMRNTYTAV